MYANHGRAILVFTCLALGLSVAAQAQMQGQTITINPQGKGPVFEGLGAVSAGASSRLLIDYPEPQRSQILDYLFKPGYGASLQHLKVEIGADVNSTDGSEPSAMRSRDDKNFHRGYEWWLMQEARKRNPKIILDTLPWGAPAWIDNGHLYSKDMAEYVAAFLEGGKKEYNLDIAYTGVWNETPYNADYVKTLHSVLRAAHLNTKIVCCDEYPGEGDGQWQIAKAMRQDAELRNSVDVLSVHYPWIYNQVTTTEDARASGKPLWSSEDQPNSGGGPIVSRNWNEGGRLLAKLYNLNYLQGGFTKTEIWSPVTSYFDILAAPGSGLMRANTPWSGHYDVESAIWVTAHTTQFAQPGWRYDDASSGYLVHGGSYVTLLSPDRQHWSTVIESIDARTPQRVRFQVPVAVGDVVHLWQTDAKHTFDEVATLHETRGEVSFTLDPDAIYTVTNTTGQGRGTAEPPPASAFPVPWKDDFETGNDGAARPFLADQDGAFEKHACRDRAGSCLEQVITHPPIPWGPLPDPFTLTGDMNHADYRVAVDVQVPAGGQATVFGRIDSANVFSDQKTPYPSGYGVIFKSSGRWELIATSYHHPQIALGSGEVAQTEPGQWHHIELAFHGSEIRLTIDGHSLLSTHDSTHTRGLFAVGCNWTRVQFDNLEVTPAP